MRNRLPILVASLVGLAAGYLLNGPWVSAQQGSAAPASIAAIANQKGGQDIFGPYDAAVGWPKKLSSIPGHGPWTFGAGQSVFAESANHVFVLERGELPDMPTPRTQKLPQFGPSVAFPIGRLPWRDATSASPPGNGGTGQLAEEGMQAWEGAGNKFDVDARWAHCILVFDAEGNLVEDWTQWDSMLQRPHFVAINPYDAEKNVWIIDDHKHVIHKFTHDGKKEILTVGTYGVPGNDGTHFNRPTYMDWFANGDFVVADGYNGTRVVKFDKDGKFVKAWGEKGSNMNDTRPAFFNNVHGISIDSKTQRIFVNDRGNHRVQVFDKDGTFLDQWRFGDNPSDVHLLHIIDGYLWAADRGTNKVLKYDLNGHFLYSWGTWGDFAGGMWGTHGFSVDPDGNFYVAEVDNGGAHKYTPRAGANPAYMVGKPLRVAWK